MREMIQTERDYVKSLEYIIEVIAICARCLKFIFSRNFIITLVARARARTRADV